MTSGTDDDTCPESVTQSMVSGTDDDTCPSTQGLSATVTDDDTGTAVSSCKVISNSQFCFHAKWAVDAQRSWAKLIGALISIIHAEL